MWIENCETNGNETLSELKDNIDCTIEAEMREAMWVGYDYSLDRETFSDSPEDVVIILKNLENRAWARLRVHRSDLANVNQYIISRLNNPDFNPPLGNEDRLRLYFRDIIQKVDHIRMK